MIQENSAYTGLDFSFTKIVLRYSIFNIQYVFPRNKRPGQTLKAELDEQVTMQTRNRIPYNFVGHFVVKKDGKFFWQVYFTSLLSCHYLKKKNIQSFNKVI